MEGLFKNLQDFIYAEPINRQLALEAFYDLRNAYDKLPTNPTFKFAIGQEVWFIKNNTVQKGNVRVRQITESNQSLSKEVDYFSRSVNDKLVVVYSLVESKTADPNWLLNERSLFASKQELLDSL